MKNKYVNMGIGWLKSGKDGSQYISAVGGDQRDGSSLFLRDSSGKEVEIKSFAVFFNSDKKHDKAPDVRFTFTLE